MKRFDPKSMTWLLGISLNLVLAGCGRGSAGRADIRADQPPVPDPLTGLKPKVRMIVQSAIDQTKTLVTYDASYVQLKYPGGDVAPDKGVCTDVVIRAYRAAGVDLQVLLHEDMKEAFAEYPKKWGLRSPDSNIDHRRVPNLQTFLARSGKKLPTSDDPDTYKPGDIVTWMLDGRTPHIGLVSATRDTSGRRLVVHNVGSGVVEADVLLAWPLTGHYRYF